MNDTAITITVTKDGVLDLLARTGQTLRIAASFLKSTHDHKTSISAEICSAYVEALAAAIEQDTVEIIGQQLVPLIYELAKAHGEEELEEKREILEGQMARMIEVLQQLKGVEAQEKDKHGGLVMVEGNDTVH